MPFLDPDVWEEHLYKQIECPENLIIPVSDCAGWRYFPKYNKFYNKLDLCKAQKLQCSLHGDWPDFWPVFSKPITNLWGMSIGINVLNSLNEALNNYQPGHFWCEILEGDHNSFDVAFVDGNPIWWTQYKAVKKPHGIFDYWFLCEPDDKLVRKFLAFARKHLKGYTGFINLESIGENLIEFHIRVASQFVAVYGNEFLDSVVKLYNNDVWTWNENPKGYSIAVYIEKEYKPKFDWALINKLKQNKDIDLQICVEENGRILPTSCPPNHYRLALIQTKNFEKGMCIQKQLEEMVK